MSSSIVDDIEYDPIALKGMTEKQLTYQLLAFQHLNRPKRQHHLNAANLKVQAVAALNDVIAEIKGNPLTAPFAPPLEAILAKYEAEPPEVF